jgi:hypothetical protein
MPSKAAKKARLVALAAEAYARLDRAASLLPTTRSQIEGLHNQQIKHIADDHRQRLTHADITLRERMDAIDRNVVETRQAIEKWSADRAKITDVRYRATMAEIKSDIQKLVDEFGQRAENWNRDWLGWQPTDRASGPDPYRLGTFSMASFSVLMTWPAILPLLGGPPFIVLTKGSVRSAAVKAIQSILLRLLVALPPGKVRLLFLDPVGRGQSVAPFMELADYDERLITTRAWTEENQITRQLEDVTSHLETVIQKYLRNVYKTIEEYNAQAGILSEPYRVVVALDFPANFTESAAHRLASIAHSGAQCGVATIVLVDQDRPLPHGFSLTELTNGATIIAWRDGAFHLEIDDLRDCDLQLDEPPEPAVANHIIKAVGEAAQSNRQVVVPFEPLAPDPAHWSEQSTAAGVSIPIGYAGATKPQRFEINKASPQHALIAGRTGSGKSTLLHALITSGALMYGPDELAYYLIDFKKGVEFKPYASHRLPHARVVAIESEREFGVSVLEALDAELTRRGELFRKLNAQSLEEYRGRVDGGSNGNGLLAEKLPRVLLIVDEFQEFFSADDALGSKALQLLDRLARQGRSFGIHLVLATQTLSGAQAMMHSTLSQIGIRIALQCTDADSRLILAEDNPVARTLARPGEAIYNAANGLVEGNDPFQVAFLGEEAHTAYLARIAALAAADRFRTLEKPIIFEGNEPADPTQNEPLAAALASESRSVRPKAVSLWLGEPSAIGRPPLAARFRRQAGSNLVIVGEHERARGLVALSLLSIAAQVPLVEPARGGSPAASAGSLEVDSSATSGRPAPEAGRAFVLDFGQVEDDEESYLGRLAELLPLRIGRRRQLPDIIREVAGEVKRRVAEDSQSRPAWFLVVYGLQRARDLRDELGPPTFSFSSSEPEGPSTAQQFASILRDGPDVGVHTIVWCDSVTNLNRVVDSRLLREFGLRVALQMSEQDSLGLLDSPIARQLGPYRAIFYVDDEARQEKFRPYAVPDEEWLRDVAALISA